MYGPPGASSEEDVDLYTGGDAKEVGRDGGGGGKGQDEGEDDEGETKEDKLLGGGILDQGKRGRETGGQTQTRLDDDDEGRRVDKLAEEQQSQHEEEEEDRGDDDHLEEMQESQDDSDDEDGEDVDEDHRGAQNRKRVMEKDEDADDLGRGQEDHEEGHDGGGGGGDRLQSKEVPWQYFVVSHGASSSSSSAHFCPAVAVNSRFLLASQSCLRAFSSGDNSDADLTHADLALYPAFPSDKVRVPRYSRSQISELISPQISQIRQIFTMCYAHIGVLL